MIVFGEYAIRPFIDHGVSLHIEDSLPTPLAPDVGACVSNGHTFIIHRSDSESSRLIVVSGDAVEAAAAYGHQATARLFERIDRVSREFWSPPVSLPTAWHKYQWENRLAFFALPPAIDPNSWRWIVERRPNADLVYWKLTSRHDEQSLEAYQADYRPVDEARSAWPAALTRVAGVLPASHEGPQALQPAIDLDVIGSQAISRSRSYTAWLGRLTADQTRVLEFSGSHALKVRGPAGTGKTLVLQLKALHDLYVAADEGHDDFRILYLTHSWALTELVDGSIAAIDERGLASLSLDIMPVAWLRELLYGKLPEGVEVLGDDSVEGKRKQLSLISSVIDSLLSSDWPTYSSNASERVVAGVEAPTESENRIRLCWDLMREFAEVIDAHQLKPGMDSLRKYLAINREPWMVPLPERADREFAFAVYRNFVRQLVEEGQLTTDQALDDLRKYLESYTWNLRRLKDGYDVVLIDEFHLFNDTERYLAHLLTRDPEAPPRLVLALDPYQSAFTLLTGLDEGELSHAASHNLPGLAPAESLDLRTVHRFSPQIHALVNLIHGSFPNLLDLGADWTFDFASSEARGSASAVPAISFEQSPEAAAKAALALAQTLNARTPTDERVAVIGEGVDELEALQRELLELEAIAGRRLGVVIAGRDDIEQLNYSRKSLVVSAAEFCAGLQFTHVICVAFLSDRDEGASALRASLSSLYLAVTRAEESLFLIIVGSEGPIHDVLQRAIETGVAARG